MEGSHPPSDFSFIIDHLDYLNRIGTTRVRVLRVIVCILGQHPLL